MCLSVLLLCGKGTRMPAALGVHAGENAAYNSILQKKKKKTHIFRYSEQWNEHVHMYMIVHKHPDYFVEKAVSL